MCKMIISKGSSEMVYHHPECRYAKRIYKRNAKKISRYDAEEKGYRSCKCCNNIRFLYQQELDEISRYKEDNQLDVDFMDGEVYVRSDVGCWKIHYRKREQKYILFHRNYVKGRIALEEVEKAPYHRQKDMSESRRIMQYLRYIYEHDKFVQYGPKDYRQMPQKTRKQKYYYQAAKHRQERQSARRVDYLFRLIEQKEGIKQLSVC